MVQGKLKRFAIKRQALPNVEPACDNEARSFDPLNDCADHLKHLIQAHRRTQRLFKGVKDEHNRPVGRATMKSSSEP